METSLWLNEKSRVSLKVSCLPYAVGKQLYTPLINFGRKWTLIWWWWPSYLYFYMSTVLECVKCLSWPLIFLYVQSSWVLCQNVTSVCLHKSIYCSSTGQDVFGQGDKDRQWLPWRCLSARSDPSASNCSTDAAIQLYVMHVDWFNQLTLVENIC